jgi:hypothetical protein
MARWAGRWINKRGQKNRKERRRLQLDCKGTKAKLEFEPPEKIEKGFKFLVAVFEFETMV